MQRVNSSTCTPRACGGGGVVCLCVCLCVCVWLIKYIPVDNFSVLNTVCIHPSTHPSIHLSLYLSISISLFIYLSMCICFSSVCSPFPGVGCGLSNKAGHVSLWYKEGGCAFSFVQISLKHLNKISRKTSVRRHKHCRPNSLVLWLYDRKHKISNKRLIGSIWIGL